MHRWFVSYFTGRKQRVFFNGINSSQLQDILLGILQGSILGVLMFIIFVNDINRACDTLISFLFADDNCAALEAPNINELIDLANSEIPKLLEWYSANRLIIHPLKTKCIIFGTPRQRINDEEVALRANFPVFIDLNNYGEFNQDKISNLKLIPNDDEKFAKHLGILIDDKLSFKHHFNNLHSRLNRAIYSLRQMKHILDQEHLKLLYNAYCKSILEYGAILFTGVNASTLKIIILLQNRAIRIITNSHYLASAAPLFRRLRLLPMDRIIDYYACKHMFDYKFGLLPEAFNGQWILAHEIHGRFLRNENDFFINRANTNFIKNLPLNSLPARWNSLPAELKAMNNKKQFSNALFEYQLGLIPD